MRIFKEFLFEAAHHLPQSFDPDHPNHRLHGHSFRVRATLEGQPDVQGLLLDLGVVTEHLNVVRSKLDHRYLNEISGLENPTLENISIWIWNALKSDLKQLVEVGLYRDSCGEGCEYRGDLSE